MKQTSISKDETEISYGFSRKLDLPFEQSIERVKETLKTEGFGVLSEINIREKFQEKLGVDFRNYVILGV